MVTVDIGRKVARLRESRNWTLAYVSERTGISLSHLSAIENGTRKNPSFSVIAKIAKAYDVPLTFFEDDSEQTANTDISVEKPQTGVVSFYNEAYKPVNYDSDTREFLASEDAPRYIAFARRLAEQTPQVDTSTLLQWIAEFLNDEKTIYNREHK